MSVTATCLALIPLARSSATAPCYGGPLTIFTALPKGSLSSFAPQVGSIRVLDTTPTFISLQARVNITNPTPYTAFVPAISIQIFANNTVVGEARAKNLDVKAGNNTNLVVEAMWNPSLGGNKGVEIGRNFLSQYISGHNTTVTLRTHSLSFPSQPSLGKALSRLNISLTAPRLHLPGDGENDDDDVGHFIKDAVFHVFSSTATFTLASPLEQNTIYIEKINATAFYNHTERVGVIVHDLPFAAPPGLSETPRLPVDWSMGSVGFDKLKKAIGGTLKLDAKADVGVRLGNWRETVWYEGRGIGASVRP